MNVFRSKIFFFWRENEQGEPWREEGETELKWEYFTEYPHPTLGFFK